jgi:hypothetical protein
MQASVKIGRTSVDVAIVLGGVDITGVVSGVTIRAGAGCFTRMEVEFSPALRLVAEGEISDVVRVLPVMAADAPLLSPPQGEGETRADA